MDTQAPDTMFNRILPLALVASLFACSQQPAEVAAELPASVERIVEEVAISSGTPVTIADISIDGMSCEMMCGGSIKKALGKLPGIASTEINFIEGDEQDHAVVTYDESQVSDADMVRAIQELHDGQYKVMAVKVTKQVKSANSTSMEKEKSEADKGVSVLSPAQVIIPGLLALLTYVLRV
ncbi:MAG: heavy metal-associated domain-containing protein [Flavobacteriales bacterium]